MVKSGQRWPISKLPTCLYISTSRRTSRSFRVFLLQQGVMSFTRSSVISRNFGDDFDFPSRIRDQHFGLGLSDLDIDAPSSFYRGYYLRPRRQLSSGGTSEIKADPEKFQVRLDVGHFAPEDITVKTVDNQVVVTARHEEKVDEHGFVSREFTRRYVLPDECENDKVTSTLSADGVLTVEAPRKRPQPALAANERAVPVQVLTTKQQTSSSTTTTNIPVTQEKKA